MSGESQLGNKGPLEMSPDPPGAVTWPHSTSETPIASRRWSPIGTEVRWDGTGGARDRSGARSSACARDAGRGARVECRETVEIGGGTRVVRWQLTKSAWVPTRKITTVTAMSVKRL
eukprot:5942622-Prymnesium_polylepis.1